MACNFKVFVHRNSDCVHFRLAGDFDGGSAHQLANFLQEHSPFASKLFIHTNALGNVHPFGSAAFRQRLNALDSRYVSLVFTGEHAPLLAPEKKGTFVLFTLARDVRS